ncbi:MAG: hypothetical protein ACLFV6_17125 [Spirulinaceae cyanobacterium]
MNNWIKTLSRLPLVRVIFAGTIAIALWIAPISAAQAATAPPDVASPDTIKRIQEKAEDFGGEDIGDTGLKNINNLPNKIPETTELIIEQRFGDENGNLPNPKEATKKAGEQLKKGVESVKDAVS